PVIDYWTESGGEGVTIELDDGGQFSFIVPNSSLSAFLNRAYGPDRGYFIAAWLVDTGEPIGVYYTGEIVGEDTSNIYPQAYILLEYPPNYVQDYLEDIRNRMAQMQQITIHNFEEAIQAVITYCGYTGMERHTIANGNVYYTNGEYWVYTEPFVYPDRIGSDSPDYCIGFHAYVTNEPCTSMEENQNREIRLYWVIMETGEVSTP
ncbi:hypothetical protein LJB77_03295, partial [Ruminococcaceae bacterium OttesenSCG-928-N02]|nr:hypothetical protein [Ruminococcaceae bacterium OttesenSCG-928-N02]